jgi:BirA family biotin operon repressor/biotin-[acetyl-CoA-carboxylase] ligase
VNLKWIHLKTVSSTNSHLQELLGRENLPEGTVVLADFQELGKGQGSHTWLSEKDQNVLMSVLLYPEFLSASRQFQLSMVTSLAVCDTLLELDILSRIKWPNDILTSQGKIAGILIEHGVMGGQLSRSIVGIGLNVNQLRFPRFPVQATSVALENPGHYDTEHVSKQLAGNLVARYHQIRSGEAEQLKNAYLGKLFGLNEPVKFLSAEGEFNGVIRGISDLGELMVEVEGTTRAYGMHSITVSL